MDSSRPEPAERSTRTPITHVVVLPWGSQEHHGPLLPADTDSRIAAAVSGRVSSMVDCGVELLPLLAYGVSTEHIGFRDTVTLRPQTAFALVTDLFTAVADERPGSLIVVVNGHGGNTATAESAAAEFNYRRDDAKALVLHAFSEGARLVSRELLGTFDAHAGSAETSVMAALGHRFPADADRTLADLGALSVPRGSLRLFPSRQLSASGVVTDQQQVVIDERAGQAMVDRTVRDIAERITTTLRLVNA